MPAILEVRVNTVLTIRLVLLSVQCRGAGVIAGALGTSRSMEEGRATRTAAMSAKVTDDERMAAHQAASVLLLALQPMINSPHHLGVMQSLQPSSTASQQRPRLLLLLLLHHHKHLLALLLRLLLCKPPRHSSSARCLLRLLLERKEEEVFVVEEVVMVLWSKGIQFTM